MVHIPYWDYDRICCVYIHVYIYMYTLYSDYTWVYIYIYINILYTIGYGPSTGYGIWPLFVVQVVLKVLKPHGYCDLTCGPFKGTRQLPRLSHGG